MYAVLLLSALCRATPERGSGWQLSLTLRNLTTSAPASGQTVTNETSNAAFDWSDDFVKILNQIIKLRLN